jgi:NTE family protein
MARGRRVAVLERARRTTALALRELRGKGQPMPGRTRPRTAAAQAPSSANATPHRGRAA